MYAIRSYYGKLFAYEHFGVEPDVMTLGKCIGGGFPLSALLVKENLNIFEAGDQGRITSYNVCYTKLLRPTYCRAGLRAFCTTRARARACTRSPTYCGTRL